MEGKSKKAALEVVQAKFSDKGIANMISNNLAYTEDDNHSTVRWCVNLDAIINNLDHLCGFEPADHKYQGPTFFLNGAKSVTYPDNIYTQEFPNAKLHQIEGAGHYIYSDKALTTARLLAECLQTIEK